MWAILLVFIILVEGHNKKSIKNSNTILSGLSRMQKFNKDII